MAQSVTLTRFYRAYYQWVLDGASNDFVFKCDQGLCGNLSNWLWFKGRDHTLAEKEMYAQFRAAGLDPDFPFNTEGGYKWPSENYVNEKDKTHNPRRIAWVKAHLE